MPCVNSRCWGRYFDYTEVCVKGVIVIAAVVALAAAGLTPPAQAWRVGAAPGVETEYVVLYKKGASAADARRAVKSAGGTIVKENGAVGVATITTTNADFAGAVRDSGPIEGVAHNRSVSGVPAPGGRTEAREAAPEGAVERAGDGAPAGPVRSRPLGMRSGKPSGRPLGMRAGGSPGQTAGQAGTRRRAAGRAAVGHAADRRHGRRLLPLRAGRRACWSASSTPASTARTPTSPRTSTSR